MVKGWVVELRGMERGGERLFLPAILGEQIESFLELPFRAGFDTVLGRAVERGGKGWRTTDAVGLFSHYPVGLREADTQCLPFSNYVGALSRNRWYFERNGKISGCAEVHLGGCMSVSSGYTFRRTTSTSDAEPRARPTTCARLSRHANIVAMLLLSPGNGF